MSLLLLIYQFFFDFGFDRNRSLFRFKSVDRLLISSINFLVYRKREVNLKVLKVPEMEQKVKSLFDSLSTCCLRDLIRRIRDFMNI